MIKTGIKIIITAAGAAVMIWLLASYIDVVSHNLEAHPIYQAWNVFTRLGS